MNLIDRYIYAVARKLPQKQRADIEKEIRTLIDDMLEEYPEELSEEAKISKVLLKLGDPEKLADNYREAKRYLIGPQLYDNYIFMLKIVSYAILLGISIATVVGGFFDSTINPAKVITSYIATLVGALTQGFAWVTIGFAATEYYGVDLKDKDFAKGEWSLSALPQIPEKEQLISRVGSAFGILFGTVFASIFYFAPQVFAAYLRSGDYIPLFDLAVLSRYKYLIILVFILGILKEIFKLIEGRWSLRLAVALTVLSVASLVFSLALFTAPGLWNEAFLSTIMNHLDGGKDAMKIFNLPLGAIILLVFGHVTEIASAVYKGFKFSKK